jgi:KDO2-lipid IV(A) lauroyltransferase
MLSGVHHVEEALKLGRGALVLSGHIGNYRFIPAVLARQGYDVVALVRSVPLSGNERYLNRLATRYNFRLVFTYQNAIETFRTVLRNNGIIYIAFDTVALENSSTWLPFGQTSLALSKGPALLACRYRVPVLYGVAPQESCGRTAIAVKPVEPLAIEKNGHTTPEELAAVWLRHLHADIMRYPEQWWEWPFQTIEGPDFAHRDAALAPQPIPLTLESAS